MDIKRFFLLLSTVLLILSCSEDKKEETVYFVRYEAEALENTDISVIHDVVVQTSMDRSDVSKFYCKSHFSETFGPYYSGDRLLIIVDSPNLDTFLVKIYVRESKSSDFQLVEEGWNQAEFHLP